MLLLFIVLLPFIAFFLSIFVRKRIFLFEVISIFTSFGALLGAVLVASQVIHHNIYSFNQYFSVDSLSVIILLLVLFIGFVVLLYSIGYLREELSEKTIGFTRVKQYYILTHLFLSAMVLAIITTHPIIMWIAVEGTTLSTAFLISFYNKPSATEAAWKYLMINSVGLLIGFFGIILFLAPIHASAEETIMINWQSMLNSINSFDPSLIKFSFIFILIGFGTKMGLAPMHTWLPDAHSKAPAPTSALLSGVLLNVAFLAILRFKLIIDHVVGSGFSQNLLIGFGVISIVIASLIIYIQKNYKRLLAYSSIEHMGISALGFGFGGLGVFAAILHMIYHSLTKSLLFLASGNIILKYKSTKIDNVNRLISVLPITAILFFIGILVITGVPPFGIFLTEFTILAAGILNHPIITALVLLSFVLVFIGFLRAIVPMEFSTDKLKPGIKRGEQSLWNVLPLLILVILIIIVSLFLPSSIRHLIDQATLIYNL